MGKESLPMHLMTHCIVLSTFQAGIVRLAIYTGRLTEPGQV